MNKPCTHAEPHPDCRVCWLAAHVRSYQRIWGLPETGEHERTPGRRIAPRHPVKPMSLPCIHEGPIVEFCTKCNGEMRHVRACLHPTADRDTCTRGAVSGLVQACVTCPDYSLQEATIG